ncbi:MAG: hypothetical protein N2C14_05020, partial [Planctomycetales bacterium]
AELAVKINSVVGRTEYALVGLIESEDGHPRAYPMGKGSGSVTTFSRADGFVTIPRRTEIVESGAPVVVRLLGRDLQVADLVVVGSHCVGLDRLLSGMRKRGFAVKFLAVGSTAGLESVKRNECDMAGIHLMDPETGVYNEPLLTPEVELIRGYGRLQGIVFREGDARFEGRSAQQAVDAVKDDPDCVMINRNQGSGTRLLIDQLLSETRPAGYSFQARNHNAVAAAVAQERADWGVAIEPVAKRSGLGFLPLQEECYDFAVPKSRANRPALAAFRELLAESGVRDELKQLGFHLTD